MSTDPYEPLHQRRQDASFMRRLATRMVEDASILARMTEGDEAPPNPVLMLLRLPLGMYVGANRYDTDNECVLSLWTAEGVTHDIRWPGPSTGTSAGEGE